VITSPLRPRDRQERGIAAGGQLTHPRNALRRFTLVRHHDAPMASFRHALTEAPQRNQPHWDRPVKPEPRPCLFGVGFPLSGPQVRTSTSDLIRHALRTSAARPTASRLRDDSALGRSDGHQRGEKMTAPGEIGWPPVGRNRWPLTTARRDQPCRPAPRSVGRSSGHGRGWCAAAAFHPLPYTFALAARRGAVRLSSHGLHHEPDGMSWWQPRQRRRISRSPAGQAALQAVYRRRHEDPVQRLVEPGNLRAGGHGS
jgi:hypothetical protein